MLKDDQKKRGRKPVPLDKHVVKFGICLPPDEARWLQSRRQKSDTIAQLIRNQMELEKLQESP